MDNWRFCLAPHKCVYTILSRDKSNRLKENSFELKIHDERIKHDPNPKLLEIKFDKYKVKKRLNLLRILSFKKHWQLNKRTLINIYKSLVRSIIDYSAYLSSFISDSFTEKLERIQNSALRIIFKTNLLDQISSESLRKKSKVETIKKDKTNYLKLTFQKPEVIRII